MAEQQSKPITIETHKHDGDFKEWQGVFVTVLQ
jgi:hypothetical protein